MAVSIGSKILASDFNTLRTEVNRWFSDNYAGGISFGDANQTWGWGGAAADPVVITDKILAAEMNTLINRCNIGSNICNGVTGTITPVVTGNKIFASEFNNTETKSDSIAANRLDIESADRTLTAAGNAARSTTWAAAINCTFGHTFSSFDQARYFFNSGGNLAISGTISGYSTGTGWDGAGFNEIFSNMGTVYMSYTATTQTGTGGTPSATGFYDLGTTFTNIFTQTGSGVYSDAILAIAARYQSLGAAIEIRVTLTPGAGRSVNGTTTVYTSTLKLNNQLVNGVPLAITAPVYSLIDPF